MKTRFCSWLAASALLLLALAACAPNGGSTTGGASTATATSRPGTAGAQLPSDIPAYPGAHYLNGESHSATGVYIFTTSDSPQKVLAFYQNAMPQQGWTAARVPVPAADPVEQYSKGQRHAMIEVGPAASTVVAANATRIIITVSG
jgi:hypothetical protein